MRHHVGLVRTDVSEERQFSQALHGAKCKKVVLFISESFENCWHYLDLAGVSETIN
jgi:hypothetical protein